MGNRQFLNAKFSDLAALTLGENPMTRQYGEALANSLARQQPEVVSEIMEILAKRYPDSFVSVVSRRLGSSRKSAES
jgi:hypothetical protein